MPSRESAGAGPIEPRPYVPNHLVWAILATIFCCVPFGVVSIVFAAQVNGMLAAGDCEGARIASDKAKTWAIVSMSVGFGIAALYILLSAAGLVILPFMMTG